MIRVRLQPDWVNYQRGDKVILNFGYQGFPPSAGVILETYSTVARVQFDGEPHCRVLPYTMIEKVSHEKPSTVNSREVQGIETQSRKAGVMQALLPLSTAIQARAV